MTEHVLLVENEELLLLAQKALYWPRRKMLVVADIHFGKAASFRAQGVPVPRGTTSENLAALDALLAQYDIERIVFLGDFLHARAAHAPATVQTMLAWRERYPELGITLVRGNHDKHAGDPASALRIDLVDEPYPAAPFWFCHHPDLDTPGYALAGHVHPVYVLASRRDALRLPCFLVGPRRMILPSFGSFTGGHPVTPEAGDAVYVTTGDAVHTVR